VPRALISGITGQDGYYLAQLLLEKDYEVFGMYRGQDNPKADRLKQELPGLTLIQGDLRDITSLLRALTISCPDEVYNLAAISHVHLSWQQPELVSDVNALGVLRFLDAVKVHTRGDMSLVKFYQASSSEMFGKVREHPQSELTPFYPRSPYGVTKVFGHHITVNYRESYGAFAVSGILFNHESPRRGPEFVTRKVTRAAARIYLGLQETLELGNLDPRRDWGFAGDYVNAMWLMLQQSEPEDFVIATGVMHSIEDLLTCAFLPFGLSWRDHVVQNPDFVRPAEVDCLQGDAAKAREKLGWEPTVDFKYLVKWMVESDLEELSS
jgi:GDPmannose 4,6-dehydratase